MKYLNIVVLIIGLSAGVTKTTHAEDRIINNTTTKDNKTVIDLEKDAIINTNLNKTLAQNVPETSNIPKRRKVTPVDNDSVERKAAKTEVNDTSSTTAIVSPMATKVLTEGGIVNITVTPSNINTTKEVAKEKVIVTEFANPNKTDAVTALTSKNDTHILKHQDQINDTLTTRTTTKPSSSTVAAPSSSLTIVTIASTHTNSTSTIATPATNSTTTTATTTTTPKPKKPTVTYGVEDFPDLDKNNPELKKSPQSTSSSSSKFPIPQDAPYAQPSQEFNNSLNHGRDYILPIVSMLFIIPLVIGILITSYRRFRDCWSTRHYRRMDFLVDGMYND